jgi:hypothetical protein
VNQDTGEIKVDKEGKDVYQVGLSAANELGRVDLVTVAVSGDPGIAVGQIVVPVNLVGFYWEQTTNGERRSGIAFRAEQIVPAASMGKTA